MDGGCLYINSVGRSLIAEKKGRVNNGICKVSFSQSLKRQVCGVDRFVGVKVKVDCTKDSSTGRVFVPVKADIGSVQEQRRFKMAPVSGQQRRNRAKQIRIKAAEQAFDRGIENHVDNGDERRFDSRVASFTKGLPHDPKTGLLYNTNDFDLFVRSIDTGDFSDQASVPLGPPMGQKFTSGIATMPNKAMLRAWESSGAGHTFDLQGADAQSITMPPAPTIDSKDLVTEMTEIYSMALLRDAPFNEYEDPSTETYKKVQKAIRRLNDTLPGEKYDAKNLFRGVFKGDDVGPFISQFLLIGTAGRGGQRDPKEGIIEYGATRIDQRVRIAEIGKDYMTTWRAFIDVQNGADLVGRETYEQKDQLYRFITTPRDMATYVHFDALYQAYLDACLILLGMDDVDFDKGIPFQKPDSVDKQSGFAHWGGPHILALVTEVSTRALKAVRYQKFNVHRRLRPEAVGGLIHRYLQAHESELRPIKDLVENLDEDLLNEIATHNAKQNETFPDRAGDKPEELTYLLPMAFAEGSPMHPSYGAGHATVAGACVTILKAFFDHEHKLNVAFQPDSTGSRLEEVPDAKDELTVEGELNKLAANISIGRNMAGVHYFSDYLESMILGEKIAITILEEQADTYNEDFKMTIPTFLPGQVVIQKEGDWVYTTRNGETSRRRSRSS